MISRMPYLAFISHARSSMEVRSGTDCPVSRPEGWQSKVKAAGTASNASARSRTLRSSAPWAVCTPSKKPRAMTRWLVDIIYLNVFQNGVKPQKNSFSSA